ncbi:MAG: cytidylate kinase family protein [Bacteroidales bacterium]|nr:cytidylate kinase family protein [Bacteroidales bacterium]
MAEAGSFGNEIPRSLHVKIIAPLDWRVKKISENYKMEAGQARKHIIKVDAEHKQLIDNFFQKETDNSIFTIIFGDAADGNKILYLYDANGTKLKKEVYKDGNTTPELIKDYIGNFIYNDIEGLEQILTDEGVAVPTEGVEFQYRYFLKDHLGNTRIMFTKNGDDLEILQENHYYPFGLKFINQNSIPPFVNNSNKYLYNGKELQDDGFDTEGTPENDRWLDWYDYEAKQIRMDGARFYDPQLGRWHCIDAKAEKYINISQY